jgi:hypothetical protein
MESQYFEPRQLSTGDWVIFDRDERTLYVIGAAGAVEGISSREELQRMASAGEALAVKRETLNALHEEFTRIALLGSAPD